MSEEIVLTVENQIATLMVNRPAARNALNWAAQAQFARWVTAVSQDRHIRVLIITGAGQQAFVAGGDLKELSGHPEPEAGKRLNGVMRDALQQLTELPIPVIAAINGDAFGGGCEILTACDLRIAATHARFSFAQVKNALTTGWGGTARLVRLLGQSRAVELLLTARLLTAVEAQQIGLVHRVVDKGVDWHTAVTAWAHELCQLPGPALAALKQLTYAAAYLPIAETNRLETELFVHLWSHPDHLEAMVAFVGKRPPQFNR
ncbi:MAG TPA: enoyl-CoA hydratase/isomerase family protein [Chloroflexota bacterium]|nr:enoyl-CoA hydratase/isomerase family protein [Chloroflexota bacterium]HUM70855.1 enoyl-CoA hydratase/isomerase family protein [Chloroflexota bacterium]